MTPLAIPDTLPAHTRTWLAYLDSAIAERVGPEMSDRIEEARRQQSYALHRAAAEANAAYFCGLYAWLLTEQSWEAAKIASARVWPRIPEREVAA